MTKWIILAVLSLAPSTVSAGESSAFDATGDLAGSYLCLGDVSGGVMFDAPSKSWTGTVFNAAVTKFVLKIKPTVLGTAYFASSPEIAMRYDITIKHFGGTGVERCSQLSDYTTQSDWTIAAFSGGAFECTALLEDYRFNLTSLRYMRAYRLGFIDGVDAQGNTPLVEIGRCSKID